MLTYLYDMHLFSVSRINFWLCEVLRIRLRLLIRVFTGVRTYWKLTIGRVPKVMTGLPPLVYCSTPSGLSSAIIVIITRNISRGALAGYSFRLRNASLWLSSLSRAAWLGAILERSWIASNLCVIKLHSDTLFTYSFMSGSRQFGTTLRAFHVSEWGVEIVSFANQELNRLVPGVWRRRGGHRFPLA